MHNILIKYYFTSFSEPRNLCKLLEVMLRVIKMLTQLSKENRRDYVKVALISRLIQIFYTKQLGKIHRFS